MTRAVVNGKVQGYAGAQRRSCDGAISLPSSSRCLLALGAWVARRASAVHEFCIRRYTVAGPGGHPAVKFASHHTVSA